MLSVVSGAAAGLALGVRHAFEPDHLAAVSTMVAERPGGRHGLFLGAAWGVGHTLALLVVATVLALCEVRLPARLADAFELLVAAMLVTLGVRSMVIGLGGRRAGLDGRRAVSAETRAAPRLGRRSLMVGVVHGLAGSGALTVAVLPNLPSTGARLGYVALFGLGFDPRHGAALVAGRLAAPATAAGAVAADGLGSHRHRRCGGGRGVGGGDRSAAGLNATARPRRGVRP